MYIEQNILWMWDYRLIISCFLQKWANLFDILVNYDNKVEFIADIFYGECILFSIFFSNLMKRETLRNQDHHKASYIE